MNVINPDDILIVKLPYVCKKDVLKQWHDYFVKQRESGVIVLDASMEIELVPKDSIVCKLEEDENVTLPR